MHHSPSSPRPRMFHSRPGRSRSQAGDQRDRMTHQDDGNLHQKEFGKPENANIANEGAIERKRKGNQIEDVFANRAPRRKPIVCTPEGRGVNRW